MTQISRFGEILKLKLDDVKVKISTRFHIEGSVLRGTIAGGPLDFDCSVHVDSSEPSEKIAHLIRVAENSCYVMQSLLQPVTVNSSMTLNGKDFDPQQYPLPFERETS